MEATIYIVLGLVVYWILILVLVKPRVQKLNRQEKKIFRDAMKTIDKLDK